MARVSESFTRLEALYCEGLDIHVDRLRVPLGAWLALPIFLYFAVLETEYLLCRALMLSGMYNSA
jgi:hypothetical protein